VVSALGGRLGFRVQGTGYRVQGTGNRVQGSGNRVQGSGFRVQGTEFRVQGSGFRGCTHDFEEVLGVEADVQMHERGALLLRFLRGL